MASITNLRFQALALARYRWVLFTADWTYAKQKSDTEIWRTSIDMKLNQHILDIKMGGKVYDTLTPVQNGGIAIWVAAGARYWENKVEFTISTKLIIGDTTYVNVEETGQSWWDPVLGIFFHFPVTS